MNILALILAPVLAFASSSRNEQLEECGYRARLVYVAAVHARDMGVPRDKFSWGSELDDTEEAAETRLAVDEVWEQPTADAKTLARAAFDRCMGETI